MLFEYDRPQKNILEKFGIFQKLINFTTMDYSRQLVEIRNNLHCDIVQEACHKNYVINGSRDGVLLLKKPINIGDFTVGSICCETGLILSTDNEKIIPYQVLSIEDLSVIHESLVQVKNYTFTLNEQLV